MTTIGFVDLDIIGAHMTHSLLKGDHTLIINGKHSVSENLRSQATAVASSTTAAQTTDIVIAMVPDTPEVTEVLLGEDGVAQDLAAGKFFVDMSLVSPAEAQDFVRRIEALGADYLDTLISGGKVGARNATLTTVVGDKEATFKRVKPPFTLMGKSITYVGGSGAGQTCKVANQVTMALTIEAVGEALLFASKAGADPARVRQALMGGFASSRILEVYDERMIKRTFDPGFHIELHQKNLNLALEGARKLGVTLPDTVAAQQLFNVYAANSGKARDYSAVMCALGLMVDHTTV